LLTPCVENLLYLLNYFLGYTTISAKREDKEKTITMIGSHLCVGVQAPFLSKYLLPWSKQFIINIRAVFSGSYTVKF